MFPLTSPRLCWILPGCILQRLIRIGHICPCPRHTSTPRSQNILQQGPSALSHFSVDIWRLSIFSSFCFCPTFFKVLYTFLLYLLSMCLLSISISTLCIYTVYLHCVSGGHFPFPKHSQFSFYFLSADSNLHLLRFTAQTFRFYKLVLQLTLRLDI